MKNEKKWIKSAIKHTDALRKELKVKKGEKIPLKKLNKADKSSDPRLAKRANMAKTLRGLRK